MENLHRPTAATAFAHHSLVWVKRGPGTNSLKSRQRPARCTVSRSRPRWSMQAPGGAFTGPTYDFIIVGAGAAGSVLAHRLVNARFADGKRGAPRVLLLENGGTLDDAPIYEHIPLGFSQLLGSRLDYGFYSREDPAQMGGRGSLYFPRGMGEGGSHAISVMLYVRGSFLDYAFWEERYGATGWGPLDVIPYFKRSESNERAESQDAFGAKSREFHGADGPLRVCNQRHPNPMSLAFLRAAELEGSRRNPDFNDWNEGQEGIGMYQVTQRDGRRESPATAFLRPIRGRRNLHIETHALAERVVLDEEQRRAIGVSYIDRHGKRVIAHAACEVLLAAGAIGTPQLLMLSGIGPGEHLRSLGLKVVRDSVGVGSNLQDHAAVVVSHYSPDPFQDDRQHKQLYYTELLGKDPWTLFQYFALGTGPLTSPICEAGGFYHTRADAEDYGCDLQLRFRRRLSDEHQRAAGRIRGAVGADTAAQSRLGAAVHGGSAQPPHHPRELVAGSARPAHAGERHPGEPQDYWTRADGGVSRRGGVPGKRDRQAGGVCAPDLPHRQCAGGHGAHGHRSGRGGRPATAHRRPDRSADHDDCRARRRLCETDLETDLSWAERIRRIKSGVKGRLVCASSSIPATAGPYATRSHIPRASRDLLLRVFQEPPPVPIRLGGDRRGDCRARSGSPRRFFGGATVPFRKHVHHILAEWVGVQPVAHQPTASDGLHPLITTFALSPVASSPSSPVAGAGVLGRGADLVRVVLSLSDGTVAHAAVLLLPESSSGRGRTARPGE
eukprot:ctg_502.g253